VRSVPSSSRLELYCEARILLRLKPPQPPPALRPWREALDWSAVDL